MSHSIELKKTPEKSGSTPSKKRKRESDDADDEQDVKQPSPKRAKKNIDTPTQEKKPRGSYKPRDTSAINPGCKDIPEGKTECLVVRTNKLITF